VLAPLVHHAVPVQALNITALDASLTFSVPTFNVAVLPLHQVVLIDEAFYKFCQGAPYGIGFCPLSEELALDVAEDLGTRGPRGVLEIVACLVVLQEGNILLLIAEGGI
jgi:hypothetical protein